MKFIELFCGVGGFRYGLEKANQIFQERQVSKQSNIRNNGNMPDNTKQGPPYQCVWANDIDKYACQIYRYRYGTKELFEGDIRTVDPANIPDCDLLVGGFPCQSFSIAGKRRGFEDTRGTLFFEICRIARAKRIKYLFLENVKGLLNHGGGHTYETIIATLDELGYDCQWQVLNSKDFGVPQNRERVFIVGHLRTERRPEVFPIGESNKEYNAMADRQENSATITSSYKKGYNRHNQLIQIGNIDTKGNNSIWGRVYSPDGVATNINSGGGGMGAKTGLYKNGNSIRRLTPIECCRLQGFPDNWTSKGIDKNGKEVLISDSQRYKCLGNAVTTKVIQAIGERLNK